MTQSDCRKSRRERSPFTITGQRTGANRGQRFLSLRPHRCPPWPQAFNQTSLLSTIKSAVNHPHKQGRRGCQGRNNLQIAHNTAEMKIKSCFPPRYVQAQRERTVYATAIPVSPSPNVCCCCDAACDTQRRDIQLIVGLKVMETYYRLFSGLTLQ